MKNWLSALALGAVLVLGFQAREVRAYAQSTPAATASEAQPNGATEPQKAEQEKDPDDAYRQSPSVVWLGSKLGLSKEQSFLVFDVLNFALLAGAIGWAILKVVPKMLRDRSTAIQKSLVDARTATEEARIRLSAVEERLSKLDGEIAAMRTHSEQEALKEEQRIKASVEDEKKKILAAAEQEIAAATMHAQKQLQQHAAELAIEQAARKLVISAETDRLLVQNFAQRLTDESKKGQN